MAKFVVGESGCWVWCGALTDKGYGIIRVNHKNHQAHRMSYQVFVGAIPDGLTIDHLCRNRSCINPGHLEPVPNRVNVGRGINPLAARIQAFDEGRCLRGHNLSLPGAVHVRPAGNRECVQCRRDRKREYMRAYYHRRKLSG